MAEPLEVEHHRRLRAERVQAVLQQLWGDEPPPGRSGALTQLIDAMGVDDFHAVGDGLVSQGDGVSYRVLASLWQHYRTGAPTASPSSPSGVDLQLPEVLLQRLASLQLIPAPGPGPGRAGGGVAAAAPPADRAGVELVAAAHVRTGPTPAVADVGEFARVGVWEIDPQTDVVAFDAVSAQLMGAGDVAGYSTVTRHLQELIHPDDHAAIAAALEEVVSTEAAYRVRFRVRSATGAVTHLISHGRMLHERGDRSPRLTGYLTVDRDGGHGAR